MSRKSNRNIDDAVMEVSIEKSCYNDKFRYLVLTEPYRNYENSLCSFERINSSRMCGHVF